MFLQKVVSMLLMIWGRFNWEAKKEVMEGWMKNLGKTMNRVNLDKVLRYLSIIFAITFVVVIWSVILAPKSYLCLSFLLLLTFEIVMILGLRLVAKHKARKDFHNSAVNVTKHGLPYLNAQLSFINRYVNDGGNSGFVREKVRKGLSELLQMLSKLDDLKNQKRTVSQQWAASIKKIVEVSGKKNLESGSQAQEVLNNDRGTLSQTYSILENSIVQATAEIKNHVKWMFELAAQDLQSQKDEDLMTDVISFHNVSFETVTKAHKSIVSDDNDERELEKEVETKKFGIE